MSPEGAKMSCSKGRSQRMPISRFQCSECGLKGTRVGLDERATPSVPFEEWTQVCLFAARARENGEPLDLITVSCPHLQASAKRLDADNLIHA
jgi:hypothetical protein